MLRYHGIERRPACKLPQEDFATQGNSYFPKFLILICRREKSRWIKTLFGRQAKVPFVQISLLLAGKVPFYLNYFGGRAKTSLSITLFVCGQKPRLNFICSRQKSCLSLFYLYHLFIMASPARLAKTLSIQTGRKLIDKSCKDIVKAVSISFSSLGVVAIQTGYEVIRATFSTDEGYKRAMQRDGVRLFGLFCKILGGGPPITLIHVFDHPFEDDSCLKAVFSDFGEVKGTKKQTFV